MMIVIVIVGISTVGLLRIMSSIVIISSISVIGIVIVSIIVIVYGLGVRPGCTGWVYGLGVRAGYCETHPKQPTEKELKSSQASRAKALRLLGGMGHGSRT